MKKLIILLGFILQTSAFAEPYQVTRVLKDTTTMSAVDLNPQTVFCTDRGYGNIQLKVSVPDLDLLAHFDHRVVGENQPCITGGRCIDGHGPGTILNDEPIDTIPLRVILTETLTIDPELKTCTRYVTEEVKSLIRGVKFNHHRADEDAKPMDFEKCMKVEGL